MTTDSTYEFAGLTDEEVAAKASEQADALLAHAAEVGLCPQALAHYETDRYLAALGTTSRHGTFDEAFYPIIEVPVDQMARNFRTAYEAAKRESMSLDSATEQVQRQLLNLTLSEARRIDGGRISMSPESDWRRDIHAIQLIFVEVPEATNLAQTYGIAAAVVVYLPSAWERDDGSIGSSYFSPEGVLGIGQMYHTRREAKEAMRELSQAMNTIRQAKRRADDAQAKFEADDDPFAAEAKALKWGGITVL